MRLVWDLIFSAEVGRIEWRDSNSRLEGERGKWRGESEGGGRGEVESEGECQTLV